MDRLPFAGFYQAQQLQRWRQAIPGRFSCRDFVAPAQPEVLLALESALAGLCLKGIRIHLVREGGEQLVLPLPLFPRFSGLQQYALILADRDIPLPRLRGGVSAQAFALEANSLGIQGCLMTGNYRRDIAREHAGKNEELLAVFPFGQPDEPLGAAHRSRRPLKHYCLDDPAPWPLWAYQAAEAVRWAPSALNRQPWKMSFSGNTLSLMAGRMDSLDLGIAALHLECAIHDQERAWRQGADRRRLIVHVADRTTK